MKKLFLFLAAVVVIQLFSQSAYAQNVTVNPGAGSYATLKAAFDAINAGTHTGTITIDIVGNTTETASAILNASGIGSANYTTITISPNGGTAKTITGNLALPLIDLNGADNVTINGLNTGGNTLTIANTNTGTTSATSTIRFIGGATNNTITNCNLQGSMTMPLGTNGGIVFFSTDGLTANGNDNNTISNCNIGPAGSNLPTKCIYANGSTSTSAIFNSNNTISNNNIFDFFLSSTSVSGIHILSGNDNWTINNNRIFQTGARTFSATALRYAGITVNSTTSPYGSFNVTNNVIGFGSNSGTGLTTISGSSNEFRGIDLISVSTSTATSVQGNTVSGIVQTSSRAGTTSGTGPFSGIALGVTRGLFNIGNISGNTIGSLDGSTTVTVNASSTTANTVPVIGIFDWSLLNSNISNNNIGSITINNGGSGTTVGFRGILISGTNGITVTLNNNTIGGTASNSITDNIVGSYAMYGIQVTNSNLSASNNLVRNMTGNSNGASLVINGGIIASASTGINNISQNIIHSLLNNSGAASNSIYAISLTLPSTANIIERNFIHSLSNTGSNAGCQLWGINAGAAGTATYRNNMVRLGFNPDGSSITTGFSIIGIRESAGSTNNVYHNSVYIGGSGVVSSSNTYCFLSSVITVTRNFQNNIFWNSRSNSSGSIANVSIGVGGTTVNPPGLTSNYNLLYANGTNGVIGVFNSTIYTTIADWRTATGQDVNSFNSDPKFIAPNGSSTTVDLHIDPTLPTDIESGGTLVASVTTDYDGQTRSGLTPVDIGADAGDFTPGTDVTPPLISYTLLSNTTSLSNRSFAGVSITDVSGVNVDPGTKPRVYYKRTSDANEWNDNTSASDGWKYAEANGSSTPFDFTIDYSLLNGGGVTAGDVVQYLVVAQDLAGTPNVGINAGTFANPQLSVNLDASAFPIGGSINSYIIVGAPLSGTYTIGLSMMRPLTGKNLEFTAKTRKVKKMVPVENDKQVFSETKKGEERLAEQFTSGCSVDLTGVTMKEIEVEETYYELQESGVKYEGPMYAEYNNRPGTLNNTNRNENSGYTGDAIGNYATITAAVTDLNNRGVSGAVTFLLIDNGNYAGETYPIQFNNNISGISAVNNVTLRPQTSIISTIPGNINSNAVIRILSSYVTIDGSNSGGTDRSLTIQNNSATGPGVVLVGSTGTTPITNVTVKNCILTNGANTSSAVVVSDGTTIGSAGYFNTVTIQNNQIERAYIGVYATGGTSAANGFNLVVSDNTLTTSGANSIRLVGLYAQYVNGLTFSGNTISNIANTTDAATLGGIWTASGCSNVTISGNNIGTISSTANSSSNIDFGIYISTGVLNGTYNVTGNTISNIFTGTSATTSGIAVTGTTSGVTIQKNKISNIKNSNTTGYGANGIYLGSSATTGIQTIQNNMIFDIAAYGYASGTAVSDNGYGIIITAGTNQRVYNNTVLLNTSQTVNGLPACLNITSGVTTASGTDVRNNILVNTQTIGTNRYAIYSGAASSVYSNINYNSYYTTGANVGYIGSNRATVENFRTGTGKDAQSFSISPIFISSTDLHIDPSDLSVSGRGNYIATVTEDFDGDSRPTTQSTTVKPVDVGCDQYSVSPFATGNVTALSGSTYFDGSLRAVEIISGSFTTTQLRQFTGVRTPNNTLLKNNPPVKNSKPVNDSKKNSVPVKKSSNKKQGTSGGETDAMAANTPWLYWEIDNLVPVSEPIILRFYYNEDQLATIPEADLKLSFWNGSAWDNSFTQSVNLSGNYIEISLPTGQAWGTTALFSMEDGGAPLPVVLSMFDMTVSNRDINLQWSTETEINNKGFSIERRMKTADRQYSAWKEVSFVNGKGNSTSRVDYTYTDKKLNSGAYQYRLKQIDYNGNYEYHSPANSADMIIGKPGSFDISQNYPNPSNPKSKIDFSMPFDGKVTIKVYDILGKEVASLINEFKPADFYTVEFDGSNISSGTYFYRIIAEGNNQKFTKTMKMILVK